MKIIEEIWDKVYDYGLNVRKNNIDGFQAWNKIKPILKKYNQAGEWLPEATDRYQELTKDPFNIVDEENNKECSEERKLEWEVKHFFF